MSQKLSDEILAEAATASSLNSEVVPTLDGAETYFAYLKHNGKGILCILDKGQWRPATYDELMRMMQ